MSGFYNISYTFIDICIKVPGDQTTGSVKGLEPGKDYEYRVIPVNAAGPGEPSDPSEFKTAKPRFCT